MRVLFFGSGAFGLPTLQELSRRHELAGVVSQPDRRAGRGGTLTPTPISAWAAHNLPGVTLYKPEKVNAADILGQTQRAIDPMQTAGELHDQLAADGPGLVLSVLDQFSRAALTPKTQDETKVTIAPKLSKADGVVDFNTTADEIRRRVHGLTPWPGVSVGFRDQGLKLLRVGVDALPTAAEPGSVFDAESGLVACGQRTALQLIEVQAAGKRPMAWADFARGARVERGEILTGCQPGTPTAD